MKRFIYFLLLLIIFENNHAQQASDYFPEQPGLRWEYQVTPLDSVNNEIETLRYYRHDLFITESNYEGKLAKIVQTKSGPAETIHFQPYLDSLFFHFSGPDGYEYFNVGYLGILLSVLDSVLDNPNFSFAELFNSLEEWYSIYRFSQDINVEYTILQIDTIVVIDSQTLPLRFEYLGERLQDEILNTPIGNLNCKKFIRKFELSYLIIPPPPLPPIVIQIFFLNDSIWIAEDYWIVQGVIPAINIDLSVLDIDPFFIPGLITKIDSVIITSVDDGKVFLPEEIALEQNYPNPFNPSTIIKFSIPVTLSGVEGSFVTLKIYNALGEEVAVLLDKELTTGTYEVEWNATGLPSGVYFYQLKTEGFVETKKMLLLK